MATAVLTEALTRALMKRPITIGDGSAAVTGLILGFNASAYRSLMDSGGGVGLCHYFGETDLRRLGL